jgi:hypothetical protein
MKYIRHEVLEELAVALRRRIGYSTRPPFITWATRHGYIEAAQCEPFTLPGRDDPSRPLTVRVYINTPHIDSQRAATVSRKAGLIPSSSPYGFEPSRLWSLEFSMLPHEALDFVPYLAGLVLAHEEGDAARVPEPPLPTRLWQPTPLQLNYGWSEAGWAVIKDFDRKKHARMRGGGGAPLQQGA